MEGEGGSGLELGGIFVDDVLCMKEKLRRFRGWMGWMGRSERRPHVISQEVIPQQGDLFFAKHYIREEH